MTATAGHWKLPTKHRIDTRPADHLSGGFSRFYSDDGSMPVRRAAPAPATDTGKEYIFRPSLVVGIGPGEAEELHHYQKKHFSAPQSQQYRPREARHFPPEQQPQSRVVELYTGNKRRVFDETSGVLASRKPASCLDFDRALGVKVKVDDVRNGIGVSHPGDKPFRTPEYSPAFHRTSSVPSSLWQRPRHLKRESFHPLYEPSRPLGASYVEKRREHHHKLAEQEVADLPPLPVAEHVPKAALLPTPAAGAPGKKPAAPGKK